VPEGAQKRSQRFHLVRPEIAAKLLVEPDDGLQEAAVQSMTRARHIEGAADRLGRCCSADPRAL
jgi:hypothetical protein